jgi:hypothetical protein
MVSKLIRVSPEYADKLYLKGITLLAPAGTIKTETVYNINGSSSFDSKIYKLRDMPSRYKFTEWYVDLTHLPKILALFYGTCEQDSDQKSTD